MRTELHLTRPSPGAPARLVTRTGTFSPRVVGRTHDGCRVAMVGTRATLLAGDHVEVVVTVDDGLHLEVEDVAATVAYDARGSSASWNTQITIGPGSSLAWAAEPFVVAHGADVCRGLTADVSAGGELLLRDRLVLGRQGEEGGRLLCRTRVAHDGDPALVEDLLLDPRTPEAVVRGGRRVVDQVLLVGRRPAPAPGPPVMALEAPGALVRDLTDEAHLSGLDTVFDDWKHQRPNLNTAVTRGQPA